MPPQYLVRPMTWQSQYLRPGIPLAKKRNAGLAKRSSEYATPKASNARSQKKSVSATTDTTERKACLPNLIRIES